MSKFPKTFPFFCEWERLASFKTWPFDEKFACNPKAMAEAGWFAAGGKGEEDLAECFACKKQLDGWEQDDDPWDEHRKHMPSCVFVKLGKKEEDITVYELLDLSLAVGEAEVNREVDTQVARLKKLHANVEANLTKEGKKSNRKDKRSA